MHVLEERGESRCVTLCSFVLITMSERYLSSIHISLSQSVISLLFFSFLEFTLRFTYMIPKISMTT